MASVWKDSLDSSLTKFDFIRIINIQNKENERNTRKRTTIIPWKVFSSVLSHPRANMVVSIDSRNGAMLWKSLSDNNIIMKKKDEKYHGFNASVKVTNRRFKRDTDSIRLKEVDESIPKPETVS